MAHFYKKRLHFFQFSHSQPLFRLLNTVYSKCNIADDWIRTTDLWFEAITLPTAPQPMTTKSYTTSHLQIGIGESG